MILTYSLYPIIFCFGIFGNIMTIIIMRRMKSVKTAGKFLSKGDSEQAQAREKAASHGMSYPISGLVKNYRSPDYDDDHPMVPHGLSVIITAPAVFTFTAPACPERHLEAAEYLGADISNARREDAGRIISDVLRKIMDDIGCPNGLKALGYTADDIPALVTGTMPQHRVTKLSPRPAREEDFAQMLEDSMTVF
ncbi:Hydroxyacid-oxoacid transhydrogenase, mitochondrial [Nucella lapillus]